MKTVKLENGMVVNVVYPDEVSSVLTPEDKEMDSRVCFAVRAAIEKAQFLESLRRSKI
jgi:hypothetical protein